MKKIQLAVLAVLIPFFSANGMAGEVQPAEIIITIDESDGSGSAQGDLVTARFSDNDVEFIGCGTRSFNDGSSAFVFGFCQAEDAEGNVASCSTQDPGLNAAVGAISDFSFITFSWNADAECTRIGSSTQSFYIPGFKLKN